MSDAPERYNDTWRNAVLNKAVGSLDRIINRHDPEVDCPVNQGVWDFLDRLVLAFEERQPPADPLADPRVTAPVRVKPLVWRFYSDVEHEFGWGVYDAKSAIGDLKIEVCGEDDEGLRFHVQQLSATYVSLKDAKDAYYEMYAARIFAYLEPANEPT